MICIRCNRFGILHWNPKIFLWWNARITPVKCYTTERRTYSSNVDDYGAASRRKILFIHGEWGSFVRKADSSEPPDPCKILIPSIKESSSWFSFYLFFLSPFSSSSAIYPLSWESSLTPRFVIGQFLTLSNGGDIRTAKKPRLLSSMFEEAGVSIGGHALWLCPAPLPMVT